MEGESGEIRESTAGLRLVREDVTEVDIEGVDRTGTEEVVEDRRKGVSANPAGGDKAEEEEE